MKPFLGRRQAGWVGRVIGLLLAVGLLGMAAAFAVHGHDGGAEYAQSCAVCQVVHLPGLEAPPPAPPAPAEVETLRTESPASTRHTLPPHLDLRTSRAPPV